MAVYSNSDSDIKRVFVACTDLGLRTDAHRKVDEPH